LLDLFCGAGGASVGYHRAGFDVVGVDHKPQPRYPFTFIQADALETLRSIGDRFDAIHASPPCQAYTSMRSMPNTKGEYPDLVDAVRYALEQAKLPYVIENVAGAPLRSPTLLCGTMFGLGTEEFELRRHRWFECSFLLLTKPCRHQRRCMGVYGNHGGRRRVAGIYGHAGGRSKRGNWTKRISAAEGCAAMGIDWMVWRELAQAIPPTYTQYIGNQLREVVSV